ncbi:MAG TPA: 50S ribosomal protein L6 [Nanoarchaeota archaeon]|nr:50S ribosomal protein L6 [Nanoarchaeota archaeon]
MIEERRLTKEVTVPEGVTVSVQGKEVHVKGPKGEIVRKLFDPTVKMEVIENKVKLSPKRLTKKQKMLINTYVSHLKNMISGVQKPFIYRLKVCSSHFPISVSVEGSTFVIKNFFGEKVPRKARIVQGVKVEAKGDVVTVSGVDLEAVGQTATNIELASRITDRDRRVFQDGVWLFEKAVQE